MNKEESNEVLKIREQIGKLSYKQVWSIGRYCIDYLERGIYYLGKENEELRKKLENKK